MKAPLFSPFLNLQPSNRRCRSSARAVGKAGKMTPALLSVIVGLLVAPAAHAATYTYTATTNASSSNTWSTGTGWTGGTAPVSAADTALVFSGSFNNAFTATSTDNIAGAFQLNAMTLNAANSGNFSTTTYNIAPNAGTNTLNFVSNGGTVPTVNLNSSNGVFNNIVNYNVSINASIDGGSLTFQGTGGGGTQPPVNTFSGILSDGSTAASVFKNGNSILALSGANTFSGGLTMNAGVLYVNNAKAVGTATMTVAGGIINNTSGGAISLFNNNAQNWTGNFAWGGSNALNLGNGAVTLSGNRTISLLNGSTSSLTNGSAALTVGGVIGDGGSNYSLSVGSPGRVNTQTVVLGNVANTYGGGTVIDSGVLQAAAIGSLGAAGQNVKVSSGGTLSAAYAIDQATLQKLTANSTGTVALAGVNSSNNLDFSVTGVNLPVSLGATGTATYSGTLTPQAQTYRLGGGFGTLNMTNALGDVNAAPTALVVGAGGSSGNVSLNAAGTYSGGTTVTGIPGSTGSVLQTNVLTGASNTPFGSNTAITLNNGTLGLGSAATLSAGNVMNVSGYNVTFDTGTIKLAVGSGTGVTFTANTLNQSSQGGVLYIAPSGAGTLGVSEKVFVTNASATIPLTVTNGMVAPSIIDSTNRVFLTYDGTKGFSPATTTTTFGVNNVVSITTTPNSAQSAYALRTTAVMTSGDNFTLGAGGFLSSGSQNNATGTINFGATPGYYGNFGGGTSGTTFTATSGVTFYGTGGGLNGANLNISGGLTFASGSWSLTPQPTGSEAFQTANPNSLTILSGASINESQSSKMTFASIQGGGSINEVLNNAFTLTINGLSSTGTTTFTGSINGAVGGTGNIIKTGSNTQVFAGLNSYNGTTTVNGGTLRAGVASVANVSGAFGNNSAVTLGNIAGATLDLNGFNTQIGSLTGGGTTGGAVTLGSATLTTGGNNTSPAAYAGTISGTGGLTKIGTGTQALSGTNTYAGVTTVNEGILTFGKKVSLYNNTPASWTDTNIVVASGATAAFNVGAASGEFLSTDIDALTLLGTASGGFKSGSSIGLDTTNAVGGTFTYSSVIANPNGGANALGLNKIGTGILLLGSSNTYTGPTTITAGTLSVGTSANLSVGSSNLVFNGGTLQITGNTLTNFSGIGHTVLFNDTKTVILDVNSATNTFTADQVLNQTTGGFTKSGTGTAILNQANTYTGATTVNAGTLKLGAAGNGTNGPLGTVAAGTSVTSGAVLDLNGFTLGTAEALTLNGTGISSGGALTNSSGTAATYSGLVALGAASSIVASSGDIILSNVGTISGATFGLTLGGTSTGSSVASIIGTTTGGLSKTGAGTWTLSGGNTYTGATTVSGGMLSVTILANGASNSSIGAATNVAGNLKLGNGTAFQYTGSGSSTDRLFTINGANAGESATLDASGTGAVNFTNTGSIAYGTTAQTRTLILSGSNTGANTLAATIGNNTTGAVSLTKSGNGAWTLSNANSAYTGSTLISAGSLVAGASSAATSVANGTSISANNTTDIITLTGNTLFNGDQVVFSGTTVPTGLTAGTVYFVVGQSGNNFQVSTTSGGSAVNFTTNGTAVALSQYLPGLFGSGNSAIVLGDAATTTNSSSPSLLTGGAFTIGRAVTIANQTTSGTYTVGGNTDNNSTFSGLITTNQNLNISQVATTSTNALTITGGITGAGAGTKTVAFNNAGAVNISTTAISDGATGNIAVTQAGPGTTTLNIANTYTGATSVTGGILQVNADQALGTTALGTTVSSGAALKLNGVNYATAEALTINGTGVSKGGALVNTGTSTYAGAVTAATNATINTGGGTITFTGGLVKNGTVLTLTGGGTVNVNVTAISGSSSGSDLVIDGTTVNLNTANTYNGPTYIRNAGTINATVANALPTSVSRTALIMDDTGSGSSVLALTNVGQAVGSLSSAATSSINLNANALTVGAASGSTTFAGVISGTGGSLVKDNVSTQILTGANTYSGDTTVNGGTLNIASGGSLAAGSAVTVQNVGSTLSGAGTVNGNVTIKNGAILAAGDSGGASVGIFSVSTGANTLTLESGSIFAWGLAASVDTNDGGVRGSDYDAVDAVNVNADAGAVFRVVLGSSPLSDMQSQTAFWTQSQAWSNVFSNAFSGFNPVVQVFNSGGADISGSTSVYGSFTANGSTLTWSAVPEPTTSVLTSMLIGAGLLRRRRAKC